MLRERQLQKPPLDGATHHGDEDRDRPQQRIRREDSEQLFHVLPDLSKSISTFDGMEIHL